MVDFAKDEQNGIPGCSDRTFVNEFIPSPSFETREKEQQQGWSVNLFVDTSRCRDFMCLLLCVILQCSHFVSCLLVSALLLHAHNVTTYTTDASKYVETPWKSRAHNTMKKRYT